MMKPRSSRATSEQAMPNRNKSESLANGPAVQRNQVQLNNPQTTAQAIRKRRSSINVYDQPSSLNSRLRQLETDMLRLDEDRTKLFDDTHASLATYELRLNEINAILKSRQDNVDKYVEDMKLLLQAKEEFEKQAKMLNDKHDRMHEKFTHRETTISREIKLLKNKFEMLEKSRQFRSLLQKSNSSNQASIDNNDDSVSGLESTVDLQRTRSETGSETASALQQDGKKLSLNRQNSRAKSVRINLPKPFRPFTKLFAPILGSLGAKRRLRRKSNRVASLSTVATASAGDNLPADSMASAATVANAATEGETNEKTDAPETIADSQAGVESKVDSGHKELAGRQKKSRKKVGLFDRLFR